jgi:hypothetical protein
MKRQTLSARWRWQILYWHLSLTQKLNGELGDGMSAGETFHADGLYGTVKISTRHGHVNFLAAEQPLPRCHN